MNDLKKEYFLFDKPIRKGGFRTKKEALSAAAEIETQLRRGINPHLTLEPFDNYFESWYITYRPNITDNTL
ncbi:Arm DNA-binding domain-containing protein [Alkalicoccobacillus murimartini]|uniref:Arm DNA-binding domain-containing protein n=1 Tax=Alkalicoccobacillus murimartini TaxID=171685 RepID=UPI0027D78ABA|nr:Arm DNA-binding domain-containing protein [Alkalicoccobacillus murimartini]